MGLGINPEFWRGKSVLITGHNGFKGSWMCLWLNMLGANVKGLSLDPLTEPSLYNSLAFSNIENYKVDIRNFNLLEKTIKEISPEIIIHMAAQSIVKESYKNPLSTIETNVQGTANILESSRDIDTLRLVLIVTSDKCYENKNDGKYYIETDNLGGSDPYSASKAAAEIITSAYLSSFYCEKNVGIASVRAGNVIGGGDWSNNRLIPDAMRAFNKNQVLNIRSPEATRPWQFVLEPLCGYLILCERLWSKPERFSGSWNFGPNKDSIKKVGEVIESLKIIWGNNVEWKIISDEKFKEAKLLQLDSSKAKTYLEWSQKIPLDHALKITVDWYSNFFQSNKDVKNYSMEQIKDYMNYE